MLRKGTDFPDQLVSIQEVEPGASDLSTNSCLQNDTCEGTESSRAESKGCVATVEEFE